MSKALIAGLLSAFLLAGCMTDADKAAKQAYDNRPQLGVTFEPEWWSENDVMVRDVPAGSPGAAAGLKPLDKIVSYDGRKVQFIKDLNDLEMKSQHGQTVKLGIMREGQPMIVPVQLQ